MTDQKIAERLWKLKLVIEETVVFPHEYTFKFIVPLTELNHARALLDGLAIEEKPSSKGNYISLTAKKVFNESEEIIKIYRNAAKIKGIISL